ncbi:MAG: MAPEG family protein [Pseudomonadota bacterium]
MELSTELWALFGVFSIAALSIFIQAAHLGAAAGNAYAVSDRSAKPPFSGPIGGRLARNVRNQAEGLMLFIPLVIVSEFAGVSNLWTQWGALVFISARALYVPLYAFAISPLRSMAWFAGFVSLFVYAWGILSATYFAGGA